MSSDLPLKIRMHIRDTWNSQGGSVQIAAKDLEKELGYNIKPEAEWLALWNNSEANFPDKATFVPTIARIVETWYQLLLSRIGQDQHSKWAGELLDALSQARTGFSGVVWVQPAATATTTIRSRWDKSLFKFYIDIPKKMNSQLSGIDYDFDRDFEQFFSTQPEPTEEQLESSIANEPRIDDTAGDWADIIVEARKVPSVVATTASGGGTQTLGQVQPAKPMKMPRIDTTPRPADLMKTIGSHYLVFHFDKIPACVQCSHEPTLVFIHEYLKRHGRTNINDSERRQMYNFSLQESLFSSGVRDLLVIDTYMKLSYSWGPQALNNPTMILSLIEGVLGYKLVDSSHGYYLFRHETGFA